MLKSLFRVLSLTVLLTAVSTDARAAALTVTGVGYGQSVEMYLNGSTTPSPQYAVEILATVDGNPFIAYCVDLFTSISFNNYNSVVGGVGSFDNGQRLAWVYETYAPSVTNNDAATALQLALWDIVHDGGDGFAEGNIQLAPSVTAEIYTAASNIVEASLGKSSNNASFLHNTEVSSGAPAQTLITSYAAQVPEPSTVTLIGAGVGLMAFGARRRRPAGK